MATSSFKVKKSLNIEPVASPTLSQDGDIAIDSVTGKLKVRTASTTDSVVTETGTATLTNKTLTSPSITTPTGIVKGDVGLGNVDNTADANKPVSTATQTALDLKAPLASPTFTGTVSGITKSMVGLGNVDNTSDVTKNAAAVALTNKTIDAASNTLSNISNAEIKAAAAIAVNKLAAQTVSRALASDASGFITPSATTATELGYLSGVTSAIQTQLGLKAALASPALTGIPTAPTASAGTGGTQLATCAYADSAASASLNVVSKTANYTAAASDGLILCSTNSFTVTLPTAVGVSGKIYRIKKTDSDVTKIITIATTSSQTIDGVTTATINTQYEQFTLCSDGANWNVISHSYPSVWVSYTPTFTGMGTVTAVSVFSRRTGDSVEVKGTFTVGTPTAVTAKMTLGFAGTSGNVSISSSKWNGASTTELVGYRNATSALAGAYTVMASLGTSSTELLWGQSTAGAAGTTAQNGNATFGTGELVSFFARVPVSGWTG